MILKKLSNTLFIRAQAVVRLTVYGWAKGSRTIRKSGKVVTMSLEGGGYPLSLAFWGTGGGLTVFCH